MKKIILITIFTIIIAVGGWYFVYQRPVLAPNFKISEQEKVCLDSGGKVATANCCQSVVAFPNLCLIGACGCSLENSKEVKICDCGDGCWNGTRCVKANINTTDWKIYLNPKYPYSMRYPADWTVTHNFGPHEMLGTGYAESNVFESPSGYALVFAVVPKDGDVAPVPRTGVGAGDFVDSDETVMVADVKVGIKKHFGVNSVF